MWVWSVQNTGAKHRNNTRFLKGHTNTTVLELPFGTQTLECSTCPILRLDSQSSNFVPSLVASTLISLQAGYKVYLRSCSSHNLLPFQPRSALGINKLLVNNCWSCLCRLRSAPSPCHLLFLLPYNTFWILGNACSELWDQWGCITQRLHCGILPSWQPWMSSHLAPSWIGIHQLAVTAAHAKSHPQGVHLALLQC